MLLYRLQGVLCDIPDDTPVSEIKELVYNLTRISMVIELKESAIVEFSKKHPMSLAIARNEPNSPQREKLEKLDRLIADRDKLIKEGEGFVSAFKDKYGVKDESSEVQESR